MADGNSQKAQIERQAIVIIHGVGEQRPLGTLKSFVLSFRDRRTFYSKPERMTQSFEARRIKLRKLGNSDDWIETDFYEYYWAHLMFGERWRHLLCWGGTRVKHLFFNGDDVPSNPSGDEPPGQTTSPPQPQLQRLRAIVIRLAVAVAVAVVIVASGLVAFLGAAAIFALLAVFLLVAALEWMSEGNALRVVGDVSRYLDVAPVNIERRHEILKGGIDLLSALHAERSDLEPTPSVDACTSEPPPYVYDRIVVVGHSLGSIIGYEILKHYWARVNRYLTFDKDLIPPSVTELARPASASADGIDGFQRRQFDVWRDLGRSKEDEPQPATAQAAPRWLVTDFVTIGSPLTYARILMAESAADFNERARLRELPLCPPDRSVHDNPGEFAVHLRYEAVVAEYDRRMILHHAAPFAATRWTNFYFRDDPIGGPLANVFGDGVKDIKLRPEDLGLGASRWYRPFSGFKLHTRYWPKSHPIPELCSILKLTPWRSSLPQHD
jgi:pimeloyl-ACP methyl ester carboxylesterase